MTAQVATDQRVARWGPPIVLTLALVVNAAAAIAAAALPLRRLLAPTSTNDWWSYQAAEWLINYGGGPVRRGLSGELITSVPGWSDRQVVTGLVATLIVAVPVVYAVLVAGVVRRTGSAWPVLMWAVPGGVLLGLWQGQWFGIPDALLMFATRKELAFTLVLLIFAVGVTRARASRRLTWALGYGSALFILAWVHEGLAFVYAVAGALVAWLAGGGVERWPSGPVRGIPATSIKAMVAVLVPAGIGVIATLPFSEPSPAQLDRMWASVDAETRAWLGDRLPAPFELMGYSLSEALEYAGGIVFKAEGIALWSVVAVFVIGWTCAALILIDCSRTSVKTTILVALVMGAAVVPMLPVAIDWGRFVVIAATCTGIVMLARQRLDPPAARPAALSAGSALVAVVMVLLLTLQGVPEAGDPFGGSPPP